MWGRRVCLHLPCELVGRLGERGGRTGGWRAWNWWELLGGMQPSVLLECVTWRGDGSKPMWENYGFFKATA